MTKDTKRCVTWGRVEGSQIFFSGLSGNMTIQQFQVWLTGHPNTSVLLCFLPFPTEDLACFPRTLPQSERTPLPCSLAAAWELSPVQRPMWSLASLLRENFWSWSCPFTMNTLVNLTAVVKDLSHFDSNLLFLVTQLWETLKYYERLGFICCTQSAQTRIGIVFSRFLAYLKNKHLLFW